MTGATYRQISKGLGNFFRLEAAGGILLLLAALAAMIMANTGLHSVYEDFLRMKMTVQIGSAGLSKNMHHWINDGLMALFFFMVGLEIKREFVSGHLSSRASALLPAIAALGGMAAPAAVFWFFNRGAPENLDGWAIASATDIAFALGVLSLLGSRVPAAVKVLLMAIAVLDDLGAVVIIALFYTADLSPTALLAAGACIFVLLLLNRFNVLRPAAYVITGFALWLAVLQSGVHATLSGVVTAMFIPMTARDDQHESMLDAMIHHLHSWIAFLVMPVFAFANAGVSLAGVSPGTLLEPLPIGIAAGLFFGKQAGVFLTVLAAVRMRFSPMPESANWMHIYGAAVLCGIGFTMSLFIGGLAFDTAEQDRAVRLGVLAGSMLSAIAGYFILRTQKPAQ